MASSRKPPSARRIAVALSGGIDSVVLLHTLKGRSSVSAIHVHHGLSPNADRWAAFCRKLCRRWGIPLSVVKARVRKDGKGLEAAARAARYEILTNARADWIALAHNRDDQAETVLMNLLRGTGARGAAGMARKTRLRGTTLWRPLLEVSRQSIEAYAREHRLEWVEDESNADEALTRNFIRRRVGPLLERKFPKWKEALARAARHFARKGVDREELLRAFLRAKGLKAPSEARLGEMLKQLGSGSARASVAHDGVNLRAYRGKLSLVPPATPFTALTWTGERRLPIPALGGELRFRQARGKGIDAARRPLVVRLRSGGERLQPDPRRPRRTLKNLFQEAGVPPWERDRLPLLFHGEELVWVAGVGVDARHQAEGKANGWLPEWRKMLP